MISNSSSSSNTSVEQQLDGSRFRRLNTKQLAFQWVGQQESGSGVNGLWHSSLAQQDGDSNLQVAPQQGFMAAVTPSSNNDLNDLLQVLGAYQRLGRKAKTSDSG